jgi:hypothetical protein
MQAAEEKGGILARESQAGAKKAVIAVAVVAVIAVAVIAVIAVAAVSVEGAVSVAGCSRR